MTGDFEGSGTNGRVTLRDLHSTIAQLRSEILANLSEERRSKHLLDERIIRLEIFRAGIEENMKSEIRRGDEAHDDLETALKTLTEQVTKTVESQQAFMRESSEDRRNLRLEMGSLKENIAAINRKLLLALGVIVAAANLLAPIILKIILNALGIPAA